MIETLVAIGIILVATTGPMVFAQKSLRASFMSRDQITAFYLAQDAIEFIKNLREHHALARTTGDWLDDLADVCDLSHGCTIDTTKLVTNTAAVRNCVDSEPGCIGQQTLRIDTNKEFSFDGEESIFYRTIYIDEIDIDEAQVMVKIVWTSQETVGEREIFVVENIYNWSNVLLGNN